MKDDNVTPRLGRIRAKGDQSFVPKVLMAARKSGGLKPTGGSGSGKGFSRGRGAGISSVTAGGRVKGPAARRVILKARYTNLTGKGMKGARAHLRYLQRDGVTPEGQPGTLYDRTSDQSDGRDFMDRAAEDTRQFRFIVSAEDGDQYGDLKSLTRRFMDQMEKDLGTQLDWVAVDHHNTGHPHTHIVVRGRNENGKDLTIARDYISEGMRDRLQALVTLDLGPRSEREIEMARRQEVDQARLTGLDRQLIRNMSLDRIVEPETRDQKTNALQTGRLRKLHEFGLAEEIGKGRWRLAEGMDGTLRRMGERGDIIKSLHRELQLQGMERAAEEGIIHEVDEGRAPQAAIVGQVLKRGLQDGDGDRHFLMVDGVDGAVHWIDIGQADRTRPLDENALVRVEFKVAEVKPTDRTILDVAASNNGLYDVAAHLNLDRAASEAFAETHLRRLEAIRRITGKVDRMEDGAFRIDPTYLNHALAYEEKRVSHAPVEVQILSPIDLSRLETYNGATWLDRELVEPTVSPAEAGFGKTMSAALQRRQAWLIQRDLAFETDGIFQTRPDLLATLQQRDLTSAASRLSKHSGLAYVASQVGDRIDGQLRRSVNLPSGKFAMVEQGKEFTLVPWRPVLEDHIGKSVAGIHREQGINWTIGRGRGRGIS